MIWRFEIHETLGSTSDLCKERAEAGAEEGLAVQALKQTSGRGTRGREWIDPGGNLAISLLFRPENPDNFLKALPFMAALGVYDAVQNVAPKDVALLLKWPNDVLLNGRKMGGVLIEVGGVADNRWVVVGVGVNLLEAPSVPGRELAALSDVMAAPDPEVFGREFVAALERRIDDWRVGGFACVRQAWLERAHPVGCHLAVRGREIYISGTFSGLDEQGRLLLVLPSGETIPVVTGDILLD